MTAVTRALRLWFTAIIKPGQALKSMNADPNRLVVSLWIMLLFSFLYTITALIFALVGRPPALEPWMPIPSDRYYFYQTFWTIPWGLATGLMMAGIAHVIGVLGCQKAEYRFEGALGVIAIAWIIPAFVLMWLPETFIAPFVEGLPWPGWVEILRLSVLAPIWQVALTVVGMRISHQAGWFRAMLIGLVTTAVSFVMFLPFMR